MFEQLSQGKVAKGFEFVAFHLAQAIIGRELIVDAAGMLEGIGEGAVEFENDGAVVLDRLGLGEGSKGAIEQRRCQDVLHGTEAERAAVEQECFIE